MRFYSSFEGSWESYIGVLENMALKQETSSYTYKRKVYVGKMKRQTNQNQGIMAQMMYYSKYILLLQFLEKVKSRKVDIMPIYFLA